ncbi:uncharacterized [Tachysurus ichikawai]
MFLSQTEYIHIIEAWRAASSSGPPENKAWAVGIAGMASWAVLQCQAAIQRSNAPDPFPPVPVTQPLSHLPGHQRVKQLIHADFYYDWKVQDGLSEWTNHLSITKILSESSFQILITLSWRNVRVKNFSRPLLQHHHHLLKLNLLVTVVSRSSENY